MKNIAIITARSGSKGIKDKNIKELNGIPLMAHTINAAMASNMFEEVMVSTDSEVYAEIAIKYGANVPFLRSKETSSDTAGSWEVVKEVLSSYATQGIFFTTICLLQPTSPLRISQDIIQGYLLYTEKYANAITSVCEMEHSPLWSMTLDRSLSLQEYRLNQKNNLLRQQLPTFYRINGALYIRKVEYSKNKVELCDDHEFALIMDRKRSVDIDTEDDFRYAEFLIKNYNIQ